MTPEEFAQECRASSRQLRRLPAEVRKALAGRVRDEVARPLADDITAAARTGSIYAQRLSGSVKVRASGDPTITVGGARRIVSGGGKARDLVWGTNFGGGKRTTAVPSKGGRRGYRRRSTEQFRRREPFVFGTVGRRLEATFERWADIVIETIGEGTRRG